MAETIEFEGQKIFLLGPMQETQSILDAARKMPSRKERITLLIGDPGLGKTLGSRIFAARHPRDVVYIHVPPAEVLNATLVINLTRRALGLAEGSESKYDALIQIIRDLERRPRMIIYDEADRLRAYRNLDLLRFIQDESPAKLVLVSIPALESAFTRHAQLHSRVSLAYRLRPCNKEEVAEVIPGLAPDALDMLYDITNGRMRDVLVRGNHLAALAEKAGGLSRITPAQVLKVHRRLTVAA